MTLLHHLLENSSSTYPHKTALVYSKTRLTYTELNQQSNRLVYNLVRLGVSPGDRIVLISENSPEYISAYYAISKIGAVSVSLSPALKPDQMLALLARVDAKVAIISGLTERKLRSVAKELPINTTLLISKPKLDWSSEAIKILPLQDFLTTGPQENPELPVNKNSLASIIFTSGSTGTPKGVMLSHSNLVSNTRSICESLKLQQTDKQMVVLPFHYVMGTSLLNTHIGVGGCVLINNQFAFTAAVVKQMAEEKITGFSGVPSTYAYLIHRSPLEKYRDKLTHLRYCSQAGGHMSHTLKKKLRSILPEHTDIIIMYGATEASARLTRLNPRYFAQKRGSIGTPIPEVTLVIRDNKNELVPTGKTGEIVASGPNIMMGYWKDKKSTEEVLDLTGYHTGDMGYQDDDGFFYVTGRKDGQVKVSGHRITIQEVEEALMKTGLVLEAVILPLDDPIKGTRLEALVTPLSSEITKNQMLARCTQELPAYKMPDALFFCRSLPKNENGKIDRAKCLAQVQQQRARAK